MSALLVFALLAGAWLVVFLLAGLLLFAGCRRIERMRREQRRAFAERRALR